MATILFLLLFFFVLLPLGRVAWAVWRQYSLLRKHMRQADAFGQAFRDAGCRAPRDEKPARKKKIARDVGEYVAFEEMSVYTRSETTTTDTDGRTTRTVVESQVEDAEWEEIS